MKVRQVRTPSASCTPTWAACTCTAVQHRGCSGLSLSCRHASCGRRCRGPSCHRAACSWGSTGKSFRVRWRRDVKVRLSASKDVDMAGGASHRVDKVSALIRGKTCRASHRVDKVSAPMRGNTCRQAYVALPGGSATRNSQGQVRAGQQLLGEQPAPQQLLGARGPGAKSR